MSEKTKACNLTKEEINYLIELHGCNLGNNDMDEHVERIKYLNSRLKTFSEGEIKSEPNASGWSSQNG